MNIYLITTRPARRYLRRNEALLVTGCLDLRKMVAESILTTAGTYSLAAGGVSHAQVSGPEPPVLHLQG